MILLNPVVVSVILLSVLCLFRFNVLLAIIFSALVAGLMGGIAFNQSIEILIKGMSGNLSTALSYILLGSIAFAISKTNLTKIIIKNVSKFVGNKRFIFSLSVAFIACFSQNLIPVHIAFIPILIPPLLGLMNRLKIDRRAVACALTFGLQAPYMVLPVGFGLIFQTIIKEQLANNGIEVGISDVVSVMWIGGLAMVFGLLFAIFVLYSKPREYTRELFNEVDDIDNVKMCQKDWFVLIGAVVAFCVQIFSESMPLGALSGLFVMIITGGISWKDIDKTMEGGLGMMAFIAFVMLTASGFSSVLNETGAIKDLVLLASSAVESKILMATIMLIVGLFITMGIGTSFGTIPIIAAVYCPLALSMGFSVPAIILLVGIAAALGDAGSPASDSTLGPTSGLNADGRHNHIWDTCVPTFLVYSIPLVVFGAIGAVLL